MLPGDFNFDRPVAAADYVTWRKIPGGIYTPDDYNTLRTHFGETIGNCSGANADAGVPELATAAKLILAAAGW
jgi:hypothetical protein